MHNPIAKKSAQMSAMALGALLMVCAPGCKVFRYYFPSDEIELAQDQPRASQPLPPISTDTDRGLEVRLWVVDDTEWSAPRALLPFVNELISGDQGTPDESLRSQWADWGFRIVALPIGRMDGFLDSLRPVQPITEQWLGEFSQWRAIVRAGALGTDHVRVGNSAVKIERGRPRLIARSWIEPILLGRDDGFAGVGAGVRLDLGMQIESSSPPRSALAMDLDRHPMIEDKGPVLDELLLSTLLDGSHAIVIVGEAPEIRWDQLPEPTSSADEPSDGSNPSGPFGPDESGDAPTPEPSISRRDGNENATPSHEPARAIEPERPIEKTLGELMLTSPGSRIMLANQSRVVPKRVVVVLIPHVGGGFSLLPGSAVVAPGTPPGPTP